MFDDEPHAPAGSPGGRSATDHRHNPLLGAGIEQSFLSRPSLFVQRPLQPAIPISPHQSPHRFARQPHHLRYFGSRAPLAQLPQNQRT
jgi:hypothetical protein